MPILDSSRLLVIALRSSRSARRGAVRRRHCGGAYLLLAARRSATSEVTDAQRDTIGALTFDAGHHTVYQHANFEFGLENVSRQLVWTFLHSYPFYNSEQSSQRYVKLQEPRAFVPPLAGEALDVYESAVVRAWDRYAELSALLKDDALAILKELRYVRPTTQSRAVEADRAATPRSAPSRPPATSFRSRRSRRWCTPCRASCCIACSGW